MAGEAWRPADALTAQMARQPLERGAGQASMTPAMTTCQGEGGSQPSRAAAQDVGVNRGSERVGSRAHCDPHVFYPRGQTSMA